MLISGALILLYASSPRVAIARAPAELTADERETLYALGVLISRNLDDFQLTPAEFDRVKAGLIDGYNRRAASVDLMRDTPKVQALRRARMDQVVKKRQDDGQAYLDKVAAMPKARKTASGLVLLPVKPATGASPGKDDEVSVNYHGRLIDGMEFDASKGGPARFSLNAVIPCWSEALPLMKVGETARIVCPPNLAYGLRGVLPKIPSQSTLDFDVELVAISATPASASTAAARAVPSPAASQKSSH
jgi:FKBP-type peptidyl-prolyl cis-trans isomerase FkpA/FKBP-type peptidyl-prolyl cis-trans isomerase FklB